MVLLPCLGLKKELFHLFKEGIRGHAEAAVCMLNQPICKRVFSSFFVQKKKKLGEGTSIRRSKVTLLLSRLTCSVDFFMLSRSYNKPAFLALIPPSFTSLNPTVTFFRPLQPHSSSHSWGKYENSRFKSDAFG